MGVNAMQMFAKTTSQDLETRSNLQRPEQCCLGRRIHKRQFPGKVSRKVLDGRGIAFYEYVDPNNTALAVEGLNGMELADRRLKFVR
jgi:hypothetical protein